MTLSQAQCSLSASSQDNQIDALRAEIADLREASHCGSGASRQSDSTLGKLSEALHTIAQEQAKHDAQLTGEIPIPYLWARQARLGMNSILIQDDRINFSDAGGPPAFPGDLQRSGDDLLYNLAGTAYSVSASPQALCQNAEALRADGTCTLPGGFEERCGQKGLIYGGPTYAGTKDGDDCVLTPLVGTSASAPCSQAGLLRFNAASGLLEYCDGTDWIWTAQGS